MALNLHPADLFDIEKIGTATHFNVHLRIGPTEKIDRKAKTLAAAIRIADNLGKTPGGKKPLIYAVTPDDMTVHVPAAIIDKARQEGATGARKGKATPEGCKTSKRATRAANGRPVGRRAEIADNAAKGILPPPQDFSAETHRRFRGKLAEIVKLVEAGDVAALKAFPTDPYSSLPKAMARYRDLAVQAIEASVFRRHWLRIICYPAVERGRRCRWAGFL